MPYPDKGVGDFDTSDLPDGHHPVNDSYYRKSNIKNKPGYQINSSSRMSRVLPDTKVETIQARKVNGYEITVNRHNGDDGNLQVFIDNAEKDTYTVNYVSWDELNDFINRNTR